MGYMKSTLIVLPLVVALLCDVLHAWSKGCPRRLASTCHGPFTVRPAYPSSTSILLNRGGCVGKDEAVMGSCLKQCMHDLCCRACGLHNGNCTMVNFHTEAFDFVKEGSIWPVEPAVCLKNASGCMRVLGGSGGDTPFSLQQPFLEAAADLKAVQVGFDFESFLVEWRLYYGDGHLIMHNVGREAMARYICPLKSGEYITGVRVFMYLAWGSFPLPKAVAFSTNMGSCGPYGSLSGTIEESVSGRMLLYVTGMAGYSYDRLELHFLSC